MPVVNQVGLAADVPAGVPLIGSDNLVTSTNITSSTAAAGFPITNAANPATHLKWVSGVNTADEIITISGLLNRTVSYLAIAKHNLGSLNIPAVVEGLDPAHVLLHFNGVDGATSIIDSNSVGSPHTWTANGSAQIDTATSRFGGASLMLTAGNDSFTKVLLHMNGTDASTTFTESAAGGVHTWTAVDNAQIDTAAFKFSTASGLFDGGAVGGPDSITTPDSADFAFGSGDFTVDAWFRNASVGVDRAICGHMAVGNGATGSSFNIRRTAANVIIANAFVGSTTFTVTGTTAISDTTTFHHVAFVRVGNILRLFVDGIQEGGDVSITGSVNDCTQIFVVGEIGVSGGASWHGWIDEFRLSTGVARWTANFTPPSAPYGSDYVTTPASPDFAFGTSDFTIDTWFRVGAGSGGTLLMIAGQGSGVSASLGTVFWIDRVPTNVMRCVVISGTVAYTVQGTTQFTNAVNNAWHHLAVVRSGGFLR